MSNGTPQIIIFVFFTTATLASANFKAEFDDFFSNLEEVPTQPPESFGAIPKCGEGNQKGKFMCVPYFNCDPSTNTVVDYPEVDGSNIISPRRASYQCTDFLEVCCQISNATTNRIDHSYVALSEFEGKCGVKGVKGSKINQAAFGEFPWMAALFNVSKKGNTPFCGGSLLTPVVVLTAAHCVKNYKPDQIKVKVGASNLDTTQEEIYHQERNVVEILIFEHYYSNTLYNDIALLILNVSVNKTGNVGTVCLPQETNIESINTDKCLLSGWGTPFRTGSGGGRILKKLQASLISNQNCQKLLRSKLGNEFILDHSFICTSGDKNNHTCRGDGGSPLVCPDSSHRYFQVGIVSWGIGYCGTPLVPDVYTNVTLFKDWIDSKLVELGYNSQPYSL